LQAVSALDGTVSLRLGYGHGGGLAVWQTENHRVWTQVLDRQGRSLGSPVQADSPHNVLFKRVLGVSDGYLIVAEDFSDFEMGNWFVWKADATGKLTEKLSLDAGLHIFDALSPVVDDRFLVFLSNDRLENQATSRVLLVSSGERLEQKHFDFPVVTPAYHAAAVELALGATDWAVWVQNPEPAEQVLLRPAGPVKANFPPRPTTLFSQYHTLAMRFDGASLKLLTSPRDARSDVVVFESLEGERASVGERPGRTALSVGEVKADGTVQTTNAFDFDPSSELPQPFANELTLDLGTKVAQRSTLIGVHPVGEPIRLDGLVPPITDGLYTSSAWSGERWVVAYWNSADKGGSLNAFALECGKQNALPAMSVPVARPAAPTNRR
jgi:hypothetical protein